ncbi:hypothetical protein DL98DRAFT_437216, partial [Cadophora sp. DSE1049]
DREIARAALLNTRKSDYYEYTDTILDSNVKQIVRLFNTAISVQVKQVYPAFVNNNPTVLSVRYKFLDTKVYIRDTALLSITNFYVEVIE